MKKIVSIIGTIAILLMAYVSVTAIFAPATLDAQVSYLFSLKVKNNLFLGDDKIVGDNSFTTTAVLDTIAVGTGLVETTDLVFVSVEDTNVGLLRGISVVAGHDTIFVKRGANGASGAKYKWMRIRPY